MTTNPRTVTPTTPLDKAAQLMREQDVGMLPVVAEDGSNKLVGVVTDRDITLRHVAEGHKGPCQVSEAMTDHVTTCRADSDVKDVMQTMGKEQLRRIPIVDERSSLLGVIAQADIARRGKDAEVAGETVERISRPTNA